jgi:hypothetical protein
MDHNINLTYGIPIDISVNAVKFTYICVNTYEKNLYDKIFEKFNYGKEKIRNVLPKDLNEVNALKQILEYSLCWLYLHEQAHHFQSHHSVFSQVSNSKEANFCIDETFATCKNSTEYDACIKHAFELSADYEATYLIIELFKKDKIIKQSSIWLLISSLTYLFYNFYEKKSVYHEGKVFGTHPIPAIRIRFVFAQLKDIFDSSEILTFLEKDKTVKDYHDAMEHSLFTAMLYTEQMYNENLEISTFMEFMNKVFDIESHENTQYINSIKEVWNKIRPNVVTEHFGYSKESILPNL